MSALIEHPPSVVYVGPTIEFAPVPNIFKWDKWAPAMDHAAIINLLAALILTGAIIMSTTALTSAVADLQTAATAAIAAIGSGSSSSDQAGIDAATSTIQSVTAQLQAAVPAAPSAPVVTDPSAPVA